jgi:diguanylate cyclase (GGDEF)-like protein
MRLNALVSRMRFARNMILLFLAAGVVPLVVLGAVSVAWVGNSAREQAYSQLHQEAKFTGAAISDELNALDYVLQEWLGARHPEEPSSPLPNDLQLLVDIRALFAARAVDRLPATEIVDALHEMKGRPWRVWGFFGRPITTRHIARMLKPFGIVAQAVPDPESDGTREEYERGQFQEAFPWRRPAPPDAFAKVLQLPLAAGPVRLPGRGLEKVVLTRAQVKRLRAGRTVLRTRPAAEGGAELWFLRAAAPDDPASKLVAARVDEDRVWNKSQRVPLGNELCVLDGPAILSCEVSWGRELAARVAELATRNVSGQLVFTAGGANHYVSYRSLPMGARFGTGAWVIAAVQPETRALAAARRVSLVYGQAVTVVVLVAMFIVMLTVRTRLEPLQALRDTAGRIAEGHLSERVAIDRRDEFGDLGRDFNRMAERLERQFTGLAIRAEIDRLILSSLDTGHIVETVLNRLPELVPCHVVAMLILGDEDAGTARLSARVTETGERLPDEIVRLDPDALAGFAEERDGRTVPGHRVPPFLEPLRGHGVRYFHVLPILHRGEPAAALVVGDRVPPATGEGELAELREFTNRVAVALSNAAWEEKLYQQAHYDSLTGLPNRVLMRDRLEQAMVRAHRGHGQVAVLFLDVDRFKAVNDSLSHSAGDMLLKRIAEVLASSIRETDTAVRFGGDEFVVVLSDLPPDADGTGHVIDVVDRILEAARTPIDVMGQSIRASVSIGVALYPKDATDFDELLRNADTAMYHAKGIGASGYEFYAPELNVAAVERLALEQELPQALELGQFRVHYQPQVEAETGRIVGVEALVRWEHPQKGLISPDIFVPVAEETGLIGAIGEWVMGTAATQVRAWQDAGLPKVRLGVNVAPQQLLQENFPDMVARILEETGLEPAGLELEVTEGAIMSDTERNVATLNALSDLGVRLSVDDFGTGYSSMSYLQRFPMNTLKVDKTFSCTLVEDANSDSIVTAIVALGHSLGLTVIAEGVETEEQRARLVELGCEELQGYLFGRPMPAERFAELLEQGVLRPARVPAKRGAA